jgi:tRNA (cytidine32/uridine32-2'-O)-methyltransferase
VSLVFGNEETGLTDEELIPCSQFCRIPTGESLPSMNLSHAVAVVTARVFDDLSRLTEAPLITESGRITQPVPAPIEEMHGFFEHWRELLIQCGLTEAGNPDRLVRRLERLFYRVQPSLREVRFLRGILRKAQYWIVRGRNAHLP